MTLSALDSRFPDKRAVITGAASGVGLATAGLLAARGWNLALLDLDAARLASATEDLRAKGSPHCEGFIVDTTDEAAVRSAIDAFAGRFGGINVMGVVHSCRAEAPHMIASRGGLIVNVASAAGFACSSRMSAYNASKAAVVALSETLFQELAEHQVYFAVAMPGFFRTRLMKHARAPADARARLSLALAIQAPRAAFLSALARRHPRAPAFERRLRRCTCG